MTREPKQKNQQGKLDQMLVVGCTDTMAWGRVCWDAVWYVAAQYCWSLNTVRRKLSSSILSQRYFFNCAL